MKIHLVFPGNFLSLKDGLEELGHQVVEWDFSLEQFRDYSLRRETQAEVALVDGTAGILEQKELYNLLREIRINLESLRLIAVFSEEMSSEKQFTEKILSLGIYDIYFVGEFGMEDVREWLDAKKTIADFAGFNGKKIKGEMRGKASFISLQENDRVDLRNSFFSTCKKVKNKLTKANSLPPAEPIRIDARNDKTVDAHTQALPSNRGLGKAETRVYLVVGAATRVGATSFALAFASLLAKKYPVEILDAGGGTTSWLSRDARLPVRSAPPFNIAPGVVTIIDAGTELPEEMFPFAEAVFLVTDFSRDALNFKKFVKHNTFLVGNRGAAGQGLQELAELWGINVLCSLDEDPGVRKAETDGVIPMPRSWAKKLKKIIW